jgi:hypothetical protein
MEGLRDARVLLFTRKKLLRAAKRGPFAILPQNNTTSKTDGSNLSVSDKQQPTARQLTLNRRAQGKR